MNISRRLSPSRHNLNHWSLWRYNYPFAASVLVVTLIISHIPCQDAFMFRVVNNPLPSCKYRYRYPFHSSSEETSSVVTNTNTRTRHCGSSRCRPTALTTMNMDIHNGGDIVNSIAVNGDVALKSLQTLPLSVPMPMPTSTLSHSQIMNPQQVQAFLPSLVTMAAAVAAVVTVTVIISIPLALWVLQKMHDSVGIDGPTPQQLEEEDHTQCALFRHLPHLKHRLAWRNIGDFPTPIHRVECSARSIVENMDTRMDHDNINMDDTDNTRNYSTFTSSNPKDGAPQPQPAPQPRTVQFHVKREDLSSSAYGGNKVRTLQHQLAVVEAKTKRRQHQQQQREGEILRHADATATATATADLIVFGSGGSNQVVATAVHSMLTKSQEREQPQQQQHSRPTIQYNTTALWMADPPDLDNTLNMLSTLSFPNVKTYQTWSNPLGLGAALIRALWAGGTSTSTSTNRNGDANSNSNGSFVLPLGGNNPSGVLGQVGGALELAEQIEAGEIPDCDGIYVAVGSSCTISGLIMGVALARKLGMAAYQQKGFALHMVPIHDIFALLNRAVGIYQGWGSGISRYIPLTVSHSLHSACHELVQLGGPNVLEEALAILEHETVVHDDARLVGKYGAHSVPSRACAQLFDETAIVTNNKVPLNSNSPSSFQNDLNNVNEMDRDCVGSEASTSTTDNANHSSNKDNSTSIPGLWLCGHFTAKAMAAMCDDLLKDENAGKNMVFWQTKSCVQPRGAVDEWGKMQQMPPAIQQWANEGQPQSEKRSGKVNLKDGSAEDYRKLMTKI
mmetsp:Transcript_22440/g.33209  ORF Transcript_22440/g.33209 Transcript_22440/m.33209 type:complete len:788 (-) Transcript_22440:422-2785(-)